MEKMELSYTKLKHLLVKIIIQCLLMITVELHSRCR